MDPTAPLNPSDEGDAAQERQYPPSVAALESEAFEAAGEYLRERAILLTVQDPEIDAWGTPCWEVPHENGRPGQVRIVDGAIGVVGCPTPIENPADAAALSLALLSAVAYTEKEASRFSFGTTETTGGSTR